jgi:hypothetical protein
MSVGRLGAYRSAEQLGRMDDEDWVALLDQLLPMNDADAFASICEVFARWPTGDERSRRLAATRETMASWDDEIRAASSASARLYERDHLSDVATLVREMEIYRREDRGGAELLAMATSEFLRELVTLSIVASELSSFSWRAFVDSESLRGLRRLVIQSTTLGGGKMRDLFKSTGLPGLRSLELTAMGLDADDLSTAAHGVPFQLERVDFSHNVLGSDGVLLLADAPWMAQVKWLAIRDNFVPRAALESLIHSRSVTELTRIDARDNGLSGHDQVVLGAMADERRLTLRL